MRRVIYALVSVVVVIVAISLMQFHVSHGPVMNNSNAVSALLNGVPRPTVCIVGSLSNPYVASIAKGLGMVNVPFTVESWLPGNASCSMVVIEDDLLSLNSSYYRREVINYLGRGIPVEVVGSNAGNALLNLIGNFISERATVVIGEPGPPNKTVIPELPSGITAVMVTMIPSKNASRFVTGWDIFEGLPSNNLTYAVLRGGWRDYDSMLTDMNNKLYAPVPTLTLGGVPRIKFQSSATSTTVFIQGFTYVGYVGWYSSSTYDWYGELAGEQWAMVKFYYAYQQSPPGPYWWFLNLIQHEVEGFSTSDPSLGFIPCYAGEGVNAYSNTYPPGQVFWSAAPTGSSSSQQTISYTLSAGPSGVYVQVSETVTQGTIGWGYSGNPSLGQDKWTWNFNNPEIGYTYVVIPSDIFMLDPSKPGGYPPLYETINFTSTFGNFLGCFNSPSPITVTVDVFTNQVTVVSSST
ncbi:hypothetical protein [Vulcanisaeta distributa]|uniref:hypothetical protein n=1 Tax=Vulcanisaeta distributa TaxID=164451 RepID=UPI0006CFEE9E|nr:hypothetical protein [Vulcanisaeta distributa]